MSRRLPSTGRGLERHDETIQTATDLIVVWLRRKPWAERLNTFAVAGRVTAERLNLLIVTWRNSSAATTAPRTSRLRKFHPKSAAAVSGECLLRVPVGLGLAPDSTD